MKPEELALELWWPHHPSRNRATALAELAAGSTGQVSVEFADVVNLIRRTMETERELCAMIADAFADVWRAAGVDAAQESAAASMAASIAARIRERSK